MGKMMFGVNLINNKVIGNLLLLGLFPLVVNDIMYHGYYKNYLHPAVDED